MRIVSEAIADFRGDLAAEVKAIQKAVVAGTRRTASRIVRAARAQVRRGFRSSPQLPNVIRRRDIRGAGGQIDAIEIRSSWTARRRGGRIDILAAFARGDTIRAPGGRWLVIPTEYAPLVSTRGRGRRMSMSQFLGRYPQREIAVLRRAGRMIIGLRRPGGRIEPWYVLVRSVQLPRRVDLEAPVERAIGYWGQDIVAALERASR